MRSLGLPVAIIAYLASVLNRCFVIVTCKDFPMTGRPRLAVGFYTDPMPGDLLNTLPTNQVRDSHALITVYTVTQGCPTL